MEVIDLEDQKGHDFTKKKKTKLLIYDVERIIILNQSSVKMTLLALVTLFLDNFLFNLLLDDSSKIKKKKKRAFENTLNPGKKKTIRESG